ncbi:two component transcriptional regulator, winged helix family protein [Plesiocystis pacifica SIR-1]|uniref:Two component transcriptional regulator, winged helix family protein n=1 Tax=Plesiocystis pacifica SIR-1 TaxID=391625 RepID=A6G9Y3_9BACT|nr:response regulator transcription factor [Plesiocystis pacifica]EDM77308.1 two component transcriptional regulator, winged helix family protein [Plesiocystis pacifica SIR-1]
MSTSTDAVIGVLLVDADPHHAELLRSYLGARGCHLDCADSLDGALQLVHSREGSGEFEMVVLDLALPDGDGLELCRRLRARSSVPIIATRAQADPWHSVAALEAGADDFVAKPVPPAELLARIRARIRRRRGQLGANEGRVEIGGLRLHRARAEVFVGEAPARLTAAEFHVLWSLAVRAGAAVHREELALGVDISPRSVDVHVSRIRTKLGEAAAAGAASAPPPSIRSIRGFGYALSAESEEA